ncbi:MAG: sodium/solute symporter [Bacteroidales bacterium]|nr:sodium/solute symporter [Bacteroidales bacterium]
MNTHTDSITDAISTNGLESLDYIIILTYIVLLLGLGFLLGMRDKHKTSTNDYFLAGNSLTWWAVGASLIAANISAEQIIGMSGTGYAHGIAISAYELMAAVTIVVICRWLLPIMMDQRVLTFPQFLQKRYSDTSSLSFSIVYLFLYVFVNLTSVAWLSAMALEQMLGVAGMGFNILGVYISFRILFILILFFIAGAYSIYGGMVSVAWTDVMQFVFIIGGGIAVAIFALQAAGGEDGTIKDGLKRMLAFFLDREHYNDSHMHLIVQKTHSYSGFDNVPGIAAIVGSVWVTNISYWAYNQFVTQKALAARNLEHAQKGFLFAASMKMLIPFIVLVPSICAYYMVNTENEEFPATGEILSADGVYPWFVTNFIPTGVRGLAIVVLLAGATSSLASMLNSTSTIFSIDIYQKYIKKDASERLLVSIGRITSVVALILATLAVHPLLGSVEQGFRYIQEYSSYIYPAVAILLTMGLMWKLASDKASLWVAGLTIPLSLLFKWLIPDVPFTFRAGYVYIILLIVFVVLSLKNKNVIPNTAYLKERRMATRKGAIFLSCVSVLSILVALVATVGNLFLPASATPENSVIAYMNDIGFEAFFFFGFFIGGYALVAWTNSRSKVQDSLAVDFSLKLFSTNRVYKIAGTLIGIIIALLYILLW